MCRLLLFALQKLAEQQSEAFMGFMHHILSLLSLDRCAASFKALRCSSACTECRVAGLQLHSVQECSYVQLLLLISCVILRKDCKALSVTDTISQFDCVR